MFILRNIADADECLENPDVCSAHALCENFLGSYTCHCMLGYEWDKQTKKCVDVNECLRGRSDCMPFLAMCTNTEGWYTCDCIPPLVGNGRYCEAPSMPGCRHPCPVGKVCSVSVTGSASCVCQNGFKKHGAGDCTDVYECAIIGCHRNAECTELQPGFKCICNAGYEGNGIFCQDVNECARGLHDCDDSAICKNTLGSYRCTCRIGYLGDGRTCVRSCLVAASPCDVTPCANGGTCVPAYETSTNFTCECARGYSGNTCENVVLRRMYPYGGQEGDTLYCRNNNDPHTAEIPIQQGFQFFGNRHRSLYIHLFGFIYFDRYFDIVWSTPRNLSLTIVPTTAWMSPLYTVMGTFNTCKLNRTLAFYQIYEQLAPTQPVDDRTRYVMSLARRDVTTLTDDASFVPSLVVVITWYKSVRFPAAFYARLPETLTYQLILISDIATTRSYALFLYESLTWNRLSMASIGYISPTSSGAPIVYTHPDTEKSTANTLDERSGNTGETGRWLYRVTAVGDEQQKGAEYRCHMWRLRQRDSEAMISLGRLALPVCPCHRATAEKDVRFTMKENGKCALSKISSGTGTMAQYCCYHDDGTLRTTHEFSSGSMFLFHPTHYPTKHSEQDDKPKVDCCLLSSVCDLFHEYRPLSTCVP
ncbi:hypothetical protein LSAT2_009862 [Lamellibrachia satsuma]|nr:hypothetical protein LSAT2_009862 [Lamellibrachia satsuma]